MVTYPGKDMDCLAKTEAEDRLRFVPEDAKFCPDCLSELRLIKDEKPYFHCTNGMCLNQDRYDMGGAILNIH